MWITVDKSEVDLDLRDDLDVYVVGIGQATNAESLKLVQSLRKQGFSAERDYLNRKPKGQFKTASKLHARFTITIGESELESGTANLKDMQAQSEIKVSLAEIYTDFAKLAQAKVSEE